MNPLDILKRVPKTNCGECGYTACLAFAANVAKSGEDPKKCPFIDLKGLDLNSLGNTALDNLSHERDLDLIRHLKSKVKDLDFEEIASRLGATLAPDEKDTLIFSYLAQDVLLSKNKLLINNKKPDDPRDQILLYNYVHSASLLISSGAEEDIVCRFLSLILGEPLGVNSTGFQPYSFNLSMICFGDARLNFSYSNKLPCATIPRTDTRSTRFIM